MRRRQLDPPVRGVYGESTRLSDEASDAATSSPIFRAGKRMSESNNGAQPTASPTPSQRDGDPIHS